MTNETARIEGFSDGVLAIAITLLVLEIRLPEGGQDVGRQIREIWPQYVAYALTFVIIGIMWANHHGMFRMIAQADRGLMLCNTLLLMGISFLPFPTAVLAGHWGTAAALWLYGGTLTLIAVLYNLVWHYARRRHLLAPELSPRAVARVTARFAAGPVSYGAAMLLAPFHPIISVLAWAGLAVVYLLLPYATDSPSSAGPAATPGAEVAGPG